MPAVDRLLTAMMERDASDLHVRSSLKPHIRDGGDIVPLEDVDPLTPDSASNMLREIMPEDSRRKFDECNDTDFAYEIEGVGRFRVNVFRDRQGVGGVFRAFPRATPTAEALGLPKVVREFCRLSKGLVVVTGPTGSGKSTTLAAMVDLINKTRSEHIITIEDPIEFVHDSHKCLVTQREVHSHTQSFANALRAALREDPDIVLVGEMRDLETIEIAIETAETGHLVFGTLHTNTAATTVNRIIDKFPANRQNQIRTMLADSLKGVIAQTLCKRIPKGRVAAMEILVATTGIASNIRDGKTFMIASAMQTGKNVGMQTFGDALVKLVVDGTVTPQEAYLRAVDKEQIRNQLAKEGIELDLDAQEEAAAVPGDGTPDAGPDAGNESSMEELIQEFMEEVRRNPSSTEALNNLAWALATSANPELRNAAEAMRAARKAHELTGGKDPAVLDTLGAVYAEAGRFDEALKWARKGLKLARSAGQEELAEALSMRISLYEAGSPHYESPSSS